LNDFYLKKKALKQIDADKDKEAVVEKEKFNQKEHQALAEGRLQLTKAEKSAKSAEQAIINEEKVVKTATTLVQNIKVSGESQAEKQSVTQME
jgi:hypothetical protein